MNMTVIALFGIQVMLILIVAALGRIRDELRRQREEYQKQNEIQKETKTNS